MNLENSKFTQTIKKWGGLVNVITLVITFSSLISGFQLFKYRLEQQEKKTEKILTILSEYDMNIILNELKEISEETDKINNKIDKLEQEIDQTNNKNDDTNKRIDVMYKLLLEKHRK